ncbi:MAG: hypothetical protein HOM34_04235 [Planctomycetes bacterium]|jgi:serine/threonine protein kinase|nr:hypothetical protein [Planctomycetota bacterium]MBT4028941.1 hypothetical protein [Planctomycetota bacterium]MBT4560693.1 hypothetical protein [Planctomycetota bacterium]MBT5100623.1 hypothetical protein [Planctomycetota bacterium]MBT5119910.1 hypothetical protein [Planctomycetota bacterium]
MTQVQTGTHIAQYEILDFLGRGAFAQVFLAQDAQGNRFAIKVGEAGGGGSYVPRFREVTSERNPSGLSPDEAPAEALFLDPAKGPQAEALDSSEIDALLLKEAELLARAKGHGVPMLHEIVKVDGRPALVMDYIEGTTLRERIRSLEGIKLGWIAEVCSTLERMQRLGWKCHGDVKPENILITANEEVILIDPLAGSGREDEVLATPWYNPFLRRDEKGDTQSVAIMLYELLCGCLPFDHAPFRYARLGDSAAVSKEDRDLAMSLYLSYPQPRELNEHAPRSLERVIYRALCDEGYGLSDLRCDLEDFLLKLH